MYQQRVGVIQDVIIFDTIMHKAITVQVVVNADLDTVWKSFTDPKHVVNWNFASDDWECPSAENDLTVGGRFKSRMSAKDNSMGFDFGGTYTKVEEKKSFEYVMDGEDQRKVAVTFEEVDGGVLVSETFDLEHENSEELQRAGWQSILDNFKKYTESLGE